MTYSQLHQDFRSTHRPSGEAFFLLQLDLPLTFTGRGKLPKATSRSYEKSYGDETAHLCKSLILLKKFFGLVESRPLRQLLLADPTKPLIFKGFLLSGNALLLPHGRHGVVATRVTSVLAVRADQRGCHRSLQGFVPHDGAGAAASGCGRPHAGLRSSPVPVSRD